MPDETNDPTHLSWMSRAACIEVGGEQFFADTGGSTADAKRICLGCDVRTQCLEYALSERDHEGRLGREKSTSKEPAPKKRG